MNGRDGNFDRICVASGDMKILNTETRTLKPVNAYKYLMTIGGKAHRIPLFSGKH